MTIETDEGMLALNDALLRLGSEMPRQADVVNVASSAAMARRIRRAC